MREYNVTPLQQNLKVKSSTVVHEEVIDTNLKDFGWVAEHLLSTHDKIHGCEILIPETYFFIKGKTRFMVKSDKNGFLISVKNPDKLDLTEIRKDLPQFVRNRMTKEVRNETGFMSKQAPESKILYPLDIARITYISECGRKGNVQIVGEKAISRMLTIRK